ncbi:hypothetical protein [Amycolatopsis vastitatis]|uniref:Uncharacterized protein n=1 Tax=Amycolatopsis vastitatis TaxID=1905142 RepID=A0A229TFZ8_9PSEU|nr:hypothetical protein [Amycolatopsis vastitatis]OXM69669.1 hypothetical protein CF165_09170 [Amycolatopsis vastitatis]
MSAVLDREWTERYLAEHGIRPTAEHLACIEAALAAAPPLSDNAITRMTAVIRPLPKPPLAGTPRTRTRAGRPRLRRAERAV